MKAKEMPDWVCWLAQDADGAVWGYQVEPNQSHSGWYENEIGESLYLGVQPLTVDWKETLQRVK